MLLMTCWAFANSATAQTDQLPDFYFIENYPNSGDTISPATVGGKPLIVFFYDPDFQPCQVFAKGVEGDPVPEDITVIWVSWNEPEDNVEFGKAHPKLGPNHHFVKDVEAKIDVWFGHNEIPTMYGFNSSGKRIKKFYNMAPNRPQFHEMLSRMK